MTRPAKLRPAPIGAHLASLNAHQLDRVMQTLGSRPSLYLNERGAMGRRMVRRAYEEMFHAIPDYQVNILRYHFAPKTVVVEGRMRGTQRAAWLNIPPTRRRFDVPCCMIFDLLDRTRIRHVRLYFDGALLLAQLRVLPDRSASHSADTNPTRMA